MAKVTEKILINFDLFEKEFDECDNTINIDEKYKKFLYNFLSTNNTLDTNDIENLNIDYINRLIYILENINLGYAGNANIANVEGYEELIEIYRFNVIKANLDKVKNYVKDDKKASLMFF